MLIPLHAELAVLCFHLKCIYQVTTHSHLLSQEELKCVENSIGMRVASFFLSEFDTEQDFFNKVG